MRPHEHVILEIAHERDRQITVEGWTPSHDDIHADGEMARAASCYAMTGSGRWSVNLMLVPSTWPWSREWFKPKDRRRDLIRAAALLVAEIERLDRAAAASTAKSE